MVTVDLINQLSVLLSIDVGLVTLLFPVVYLIVSRYFCVTQRNYCLV